MGSNSSTKRHSEVSEQLSSFDASPLIPFDYESSRPHLLRQISVVPLVDIIMEYMVQPLQHLVIIQRPDSNQQLSLSIGWITSDLPSRPAAIVTIDDNTHFRRHPGLGWVYDYLPNDDDGEKEMEVRGDVPGYRRIFGLFPTDSWQCFQNVAIIDDRLYLFGFGHSDDLKSNNDHPHYKLASCSISDLLTSALSSKPPSSMTQVSSLIKWKSDHAVVPSSYVYLSNARELGRTTTTVWRNRLVLVATFFDHYPHLHSRGLCCYYDTIINEWHQLPDLVIQTREVSVQCIHDQLYITSQSPEDEAVPIMVYDDIDNKWYPVPTLHNSIYIVPCSISLPSKCRSSPSSSSSSSSSLSSRQNNTVASEDMVNHQSAVITIIDKTSVRRKVFRYRRYDHRNGQLQPLKLSFPSWFRTPMSLPFVIGHHSEWLIWPAQEEQPIQGYVRPKWKEHLEERKKYPHKISIVKVNDIHDPNKWRSWPLIPSTDTGYYLVVSGENSVSNCTRYGADFRSVD
jgi:hypothetical protein